ncbi:MAG: anthranilate synthase component I [Pseudomonadota bacterium]
MTKIFPDFAEFSKVYRAGRPQVVYARMPADLDTPVSVMLKLARADKDSFVLESVTGGEVRGRYSMVGLAPDVIWRCFGERAEINRDAQRDASAFTPCAEPPLKALRALIQESQIDIPAELPPAVSGLFGYLGYDMIRLVEHLPDVNPDPLGLPDAVMLRPTVMAVLDGVKGEVTVVAPAWPNQEGSAEKAYARACARVTDALDALAAPLEHKVPSGPFKLSEPKSNFAKSSYLNAVDRAKDYIKAGDIFQVVPAQRWSQDFDAPPFELYRALRRTNPSPYMFFFNFGGFQIIGASPEILVQLKDNVVTIRPIAGTRPRGTTPAEDKALEEDLLADQKELAEHLMLLDLGRNDVGRVAKIGTVAPTEKFIVERYSHVMHIVSNVIGELADGEDALSALLAGLPAGTLSGAPKVRAMEIIDELEPEKRGVYGGGCGYFSATGDMDICITLRTAVTKGEKLYSQAGGGVVYDSDPEAEFEETVNKARAIWAAATRAAAGSG